MHPEWWHWLIVGVLLVLAELAIPAFFVIWFGLGALLVSVLVFFAESLSSTAQIGAWIVASLAMTLLWFRVFRHSAIRTRSGTSEGEVIGEVGLLVGAIRPFAKGKVRFQRPLLGSEEWTCLADENIEAGERVRVVAIEGSFLKVAKTRE